MVPHDIDEIDAPTNSTPDLAGRTPRSRAGNRTMRRNRREEEGEEESGCSSQARKARHAKQHDEPQRKATTMKTRRTVHIPAPITRRFQWLLWNEFAVSPEVAAAALNVSRNSGYAAIHNKDIPATRVGNRLMVPTAYLRQRLYLEPPLPGEEPAPQTALQLKKQKQEVVKSPKRRR